MAQEYPFDMKRAKDLENLLEAAESRGDRETAMAVLNEMDKFQKQIAPPKTQQSGQQIPTIMGMREQALTGQNTIQPVDVSANIPENIKNLPEIQASGLLSNQSGAKVSVLSPVLLATTDPNEIAKIITSNFPDVGMAQEKDQNGNIYPVLRNNKTGAATLINRPGLSGMDVLQGLGLAAAFTPAGRAATFLGAGAKSGLTETVIQGLQSASGGEFNPEDVALSAGLGAVAQPAVKGIEAGIRRIRTNKNLFDSDTMLPSKELESALKKRDIDIGAFYDEVDQLPLSSGSKTPQEIVDDVIKRKIARGDASEALYNKKLVNGKIVNDTLGDEAIKQGFLKGDIASAKSANMSTKASMRKMLNMKRAIQANSDKALDFRPSDIIGDNAMKRFDFVRNRAKGLRDELDQIAKKELTIDSRALEGPNTGGSLKGREINPAGVTDSYLTGLEDLGVNVDTTGFPPKLDFSRSLISEDKTSQRIIKSVTNILAKDTAPDAYSAHMLKRQLDTMLDFNKKSAAGLTEAGEKFAKTIRRSLNESIRDVSPRYAQINDQLSQSLDAMQSFDKALGGIDAFADNARVSVGQTLRRLMSNVQSRADLNDALIGLENTASQLGGNFDTQLKKLIQFNKTLDDRFGATARTSLQGEMESALRSGPKEAAKDILINKAAEKIQDIRGVSEKEAFNILQKILSEKVEI